MSRRRLMNTILFVWVACAATSYAAAQGPQTPSANVGKTFQGGAAAVDITPTRLPAIVAGGFLEAQGAQIKDRLYVRCIALDDGASEIALVVVDSCMMPQSLIDEAKQLAARTCGISIEHMLVSATHTHSAPAAMGCLGTRQDKDYAAALPGKIAEAIVAAHNNLQPARIGWASIDDWEHTHNRRWIRQPEKMVVDPFGQPTGRAHMHPGYLSSDCIGPSGPVDPALSVISLQTKEGQPLAVLANYSQHYFGAGPISADYYGLFCKHIASSLNQPGDGNGPFVCAISQGTSGDLMWMDYGSPAKNLSLATYAQAVARYAEQALAKVEYHDMAPLAMVEKRLQLKYRVPDEPRLEWARPIAAGIEQELPKNIQEVYAREALILHQRQGTELKLQAIRIGDLTIAALPNEVYALTGLKLRGRAPSATHFNVELANGAEGYIPTPEQHALGGYTTWPARTAGLEVQAEPKIVEALVAALEEVTGQERRVMHDEHGPYARAILAAQPRGYWRLNDEEGQAARNAVSGGQAAQLRDGFAWYLPGVGSGSGIGAQEQLTTSKFSGSKQINRSLHVAGGELTAQVPGLSPTYSLAFWFWLGERSGASQRRGILSIGSAGEQLVAQQFGDHQFQLEMNDAVSTTKWRADDWNLAIVVRERASLHVYVNGNAEPALHCSLPSEATISPLRFGVGLQGKLDEIAVFDRALNAEEMQNLWTVSGIAEQRQQEQTERRRREAAAAARAKPPNFPEDYGQVVAEFNPLVAYALNVKPAELRATGGVEWGRASYASLRSGRLSGKSDGLHGAYSLSLWFRNELPNDLRPVTAYLFSRGPDGDGKAPGDHLGIGGTYRSDLTGKLIVFNGNDRDQVAVGRTILPPNSWNHAVLIRQPGHVRVFLNGEVEPEIDADIDTTAAENLEFFLGARSDHFAPLQGNLAHFALFDRALSRREAKQLHTASGQPVGTADVSQSEPPTPSSEALSPKESLAKIHLPPGFRVELVAAEPQVIDPVAFDWDAAGRLWVVEMSDYPLGMDGKGQAGGRIRILEDADRDGHYEKSRVFADGLNFPNGILTWRDGALITAAPQLLFLRDTDGDGVADAREVLFEGFNEGNQQLRLNHLRWGLDNWVYCANGGHHANHGLGTRVTSHRNGMLYEIGSRDFRFNPDTGALELESGPSQYGRNRDAWGHWFGTQNANPLWHYVLSDRYLARNPYVPTASPLEHLVGPGSPPVYPASQPEKRFHSFEQSGHFTSACSGMIYGDELLFGSGPQSHAFTCEPFHNLVQHNVLTDRGVSFVASRPVNEGSLDFFASEDRWCRPVMVRTGPDGALWIADMVRYMIEHPDWLPPEGKAELLPHYRLGDDRGRIYRVVPDGEFVPRAWALDQLDTAQLVATIDSPNDWKRDKAQQMLLWKQDRAAIPLLRTLSETSLRPEARVQALYVLSGMDALTSASIIAALADPHARVRENAVRLAESMPEAEAAAEVVAALTQLCHDPDEKVCLQLALTLGQWNSESAALALVELASRFSADPFMRAAIMSSAATHNERFVRGLVQREPQVLAAFREPILRQSVGKGDRVSLALLLANVLSSAEPDRLRNLDAFLWALQTVGTDLRELTAAEPQGDLAEYASQVEQLLLQAIQMADDERRTDDERIAAATLMCRVAEHREQALRLLSQWLKPQVDPALQTRVFDVIVESGSPLVPGVLAKAWPELSPALRGIALNAWLSREAWTIDLLDRIERREIPARSLDLTQIARLLRHPKNSLAKRAQAVIGASNTSTRRQVVESYRKSLELPANAAIGRLVYQRACAACHRRGGEGHEMGPNLATVIEHSPEKLLTNILDPNADIQPGFQAYTCLLESGEILAGLLAGETANSVTIKQVNGVSRSVARREIARLENSNQSFMPEGLEGSLSQQDMADLLAFLQQPVAVDDDEEIQ